MITDIVQKICIEEAINSNCFSELSNDQELVILYDKMIR